MARDILIDTDGDVIIALDLKMGNGDKQNLETLLMATVGSVAYKPLMGCDVIRLTNARINSQLVARDIKVQLIADNWTNEKINFDGENLTVDATRK